RCSVMLSSGFPVFFERRTPERHTRLSRFGARRGIVRAAQRRAYSKSETITSIRWGRRASARSRRRAGSLLAQRPQRPAPRDHLIQHVVNRLLLMWCRPEDAEVLEVGVERERDLRAHVGDHQL